MEYPCSTFKTSRSFTYNYVHIKPSTDKPYVLFLHGFPSSSYDWRHQIPYFQKKGYGIIAPDLLGYGATSKPLDVNSYTGKAMANDMYELLKAEGIVEGVFGVAHDWGSFILSRLANYYPQLLRKLAFLDVGYVSPGHGLTEEMVTFVDKSIKEAMGFEVFGYFRFFNEDGATELLNKNIESVQSLFHSTDAELGKKYMGATGGFRTWLSEGKVAEKEAWLSFKDIEHDLKLFAPENGGYSAAINWYKAQLQNINAADEKGTFSKIPEVHHILQQPTLLINTTNFISATADFANQMKPYALKLEIEQIESGHWVMLERKDEVNQILGNFVDK
ncbi:related to epoxide hydrolase [Rhynchosporium graminicola]|uniref:Related to epoxide hydrolase n=1 Tax=Rhynchosporium graminicola TaxID=2792576 RepID=A0A1E1KRL3_9HELO|nr:related to epoxide hydrolase [Rhynchosporium commune]